MNNNNINNNKTTLQLIKFFSLLNDAFSNINESNICIGMFIHLLELKKIYFDKWLVAMLAVKRQSLRK